MTYGSKNSGGKSSGGGRSLTPEPTYNKTPAPSNKITKINEGAVTTTSGSRQSKDEVGQTNIRNK